MWTCTSQETLSKWLTYKTQKCSTSLSTGEYKLISQWDRATQPCDWSEYQRLTILSVGCDVEIQKLTLPMTRMALAHLLWKTVALSEFPGGTVELRIRHCHPCDSSRCCGTGLIAGPGTSASNWKKKKKKKRKLKVGSHRNNILQVIAHMSLTSSQTSSSGLCVLCTS